MKKIITIILLCNFFTNANAQYRFTKDSLTNYVNRAMYNWQIPGVAIAVVKDGKIDIIQAFGVKEFGKLDKVDLSSLFMIGSNTKAFTGLVTAMLDTEGKIKLND